MYEAQVLLLCPSGPHLEPGPGNCSTHIAETLVECYMCLQGTWACPQFSSCAYQSAFSGVCPTHQEPLDLWYYCTCGNSFRSSEQCKCSPPKPTALCGYYEVSCTQTPAHESRPRVCGQFYEASGKCPTHTTGSPVPETCDKH